MINCFKNPKCKNKEDTSCRNCPASSPEFLLKEKNIDIYVAILNGNVKDNYMVIAFSLMEAKSKILNLYFEDDEHCEGDLNKEGIYITITEFLNGETTNIS